MLFSIGQGLPDNTIELADGAIEVSAPLPELLVVLVATVLRRALDLIRYCLRCQLDRRFAADDSKRAPHFIKLAGHLPQCDGVIGNGYVGALGGKVLNGTAHHRHFAFKACESLGSRIGMVGGFGRRF